MEIIRTRDKDGNRVNEIVFKSTPRDPEERRSFPLSYWRNTLLDRIQLPNGVSVAVDIPLNVLMDRNGPASVDGKDFEAIKNRKPAAAQVLTTACPACEGKGYTGDEGVADVELCPLCGGLGKIITHFASELVRFLGWLDNPQPVVDEKSIDRMNAVNRLKRAARQKKKEASKKLGGDNLDWKKEMGGQAAIAEYQQKMSKAAQKIDAELEAKIAALDETE